MWCRDPCKEPIKALAYSSSIIRETQTYVKLPDSLTIIVSESGSMVSIQMFCPNIRIGKL